MAEEENKQGDKPLTATQEKPDENAKTKEEQTTKQEETTKEVK